MRHQPAVRRRGRHRQLSGLRAIVTGASSGVGRAVALALACRGVAVVASARRADRLDDLADRAAARAGAAAIVPVTGDVTDATVRRQLVATARDRLGGLDIVVAAAGAGAVGSFRDESPDVFARVIDLDLIAPAELVRTSLPLLERSLDPSVVLVGSILGRHPLPWYGGYCAAKAGLRSLAGTLALELRPRGIDVLHVSLGPVASEFFDALVAGSRPSWVSAASPRMTPETAAAAIVDGIVRRRMEITPGWRAWAFAGAARFAPGLIAAAAARHLRTMEAAANGSGDGSGR